ncbi:enoyl-ACP reductase [Candidatus Pacearchaeota archaeon]|nr:enoyl-ACP reductase [Candidatus Pacearchaeota archaeon]
MEKNNINLNLSGKKAIIFGVADSESVAWGIARTLDKQGVQVGIAYQERNKETVLPLIEKLDRGSFALECDVTSDSDLDKFFEKIKSEFGKIDFLIHSIAFAKKQFLQGKYFEVDRPGFSKSMEVSAYSLVELTKRAYPLMNPQGSIIAMTYLGSQRVFKNYNVMGICKAALEASVRYLSADVGSEKKIRVNAISFSPVKTRAASGISGFEEHLEEHKRASPLGRNISQKDVANSVLFLCSDLARNITGQIIYVDAGYNIVGGY